MYFEYSAARAFLGLRRTTRDVRDMDIDTVEQQVEELTFEYLYEVWGCDPPRPKKKEREPLFPSEEGLEKWRRDYKASTWLLHLQDIRTYDERLRQGKDFRRRYRVPRVVFDDMLSAASESGVFDRKPRGPQALLSLRLK